VDGLLAFGWQTAFGFALLGPVANSPEDSFQLTEIGYIPCRPGAAVF